MTLKYIVSIAIGLAARSLQFLSNVLIVRLLGLEVYSIYATLVTTIVGIYPLATLGQTVTAIRVRKSSDGHKKPLLLCILLPLVFSPLIYLYLRGAMGIDQWDSLFIISLLLVQSVFGLLVATFYLDQRPTVAIIASNIHLLFLPIAVMCLSFYDASSKAHWLSTFYFMASLAAAVGLARANDVSFEIQRDMFAGLLSGLKDGLLVSFPSFMIGGINSIFLLITMNQNPALNKSLAILFVISNLVQIIPNSVSNIVISSTKHITLKSIALLMLLAFSVVIMLALGAYKVILFLLGVELDSLASISINFVLVGAGFFALARILISYLIRIGREFRTFIATVLLLGVLFVGLYTYPATEYFLLYLHVGFLSFVVIAMVWLSAERLRR